MCGCNHPVQQVTVYSKAWFASAICMGKAFKSCLPCFGQNKIKYGRPTCCSIIHDVYLHVYYAYFLQNCLCGGYLYNMLATLR